MAVMIVFRKRKSHFNAFAQPISTFRVLFFGSDNVSLESLKALHRERDLVPRLEVVVSPKFNQCRKKNEDEVPLWCQKNGIVTHQWSKQFAKEFNFGEFDLGIVVSFGYFIPAPVIDKFPHKMINTHGGVLPQYRGPAPIHYALMRNEKSTAVSIIELHPKEFDKGDILSEEEVLIAPSDTYSTLSNRMAEVGAKQLIETLKSFDYLSLHKKKQAEISKDALIITKRLKQADANVKWSEWDANEIYGRWRAMPDKLHTRLGKFVLKLKKLSLPDFEYKTIENAEPGSISCYKPKNAVLIRCREDFIVGTEFQVIGEVGVSKLLTAMDLAHVASIPVYNKEGKMRQGENQICSFIE